MTPEQWSRIKTVFNAARNMDAASRNNFVESELSTDPKAKIEVKKLLASVDDAADFIAEPIIGENKSYMGQKLGNYRIDREIGRGGMGVVYLAHREGDFEQKVAVKVLKRGMDSDEIVRRFNQERQILASLNHPNIGALLDGGTTDDALPFFVMEYIEGQPLLAFCDERNLDAAGRVELFHRVCAAVSYAHSRLIVHRDLKPSNIVITDDGIPKLLDFGIAKVLGNDSDATRLTQTTSRLLTPEYASPEQVRGAEITTSTDVYSLGVILYELLTGKLPYRFDTRSAEEVFRVICDTDPVSPEKVSRRRLDLDLRNILLMALRKEPERRYASVEKMDDDLRRFAAKLPITARPDTIGYRITKFAQRNRIAVAAAFIVFIALGAGLAVAGWQARLARRESAKAARINGFLQKTFVEAPFENKSKDLPFAEVLDTADERAATELADEPEVQADVFGTLGETYSRLGIYEKAEADLKRSLELNQSLYGKNSVETMRSYSRLANTFLFQSKLDECEAGYLNVLRISDLYPNETLKEKADASSQLAELYVRKARLDLAATYSANAGVLTRQIHGEDSLEFAETRFVYGRILERLGRLNEAEAVYRQGANIYDTIQSGNRMLKATNLVNLASVLTKLNRFDEAKSILEDSRQVFLEVHGPRSAWVAELYAYFSFYYYTKGEYANARDIAEAAVEIFDQNGEFETNGCLWARDNLGAALTKLGKINEGEKVLTASVKSRETSAVAGDWRLSLSRQMLGDNMLAQGRYDEARTMITRSLNEFVTQFGESDYRSRDAAALLERLNKRPQAPKPTM